MPAIHRSKIWTTIPDNISISQLMQDNVSHTPPDKIIYEEAHTGKTATYGAFHRQIRRTAYQLRQQVQFQPQQMVAISASSSIEYILAAQAVWWAGGVVCPINNTLHPDEIAKALDLLQPEYLVVDASVYSKIPIIVQNSKHCTSSGTIPQVLTIGKDTKGSNWPLFPIAPNNEDQQPELPDPVPSHASDCAAILLSSGTTGVPKAVMLSHHNLVATCYQLHYDNPQNWRGSQREIFFPPLSHVYALYVCFTMCCWLGAYVCLMPRFDLELYCRLMQDRKATLARIVPPIAKLLGEHEVVTKYKYPYLEYFSCSAAPLHDHTATKLHEAFPGVALCQTYGCTELSGPCVQSGVIDAKRLPLSAAGALVANSELRFLDTDGKDVGARGPGEITCRGPNVMMGYKDNEHETAKAIMPGGWLRTGDLGYLDENGYLYIYDRLKDLIKYKGFQVAPSELESIIIQHPLVREAAVISVWSSSEATEVPRAFVVLKDEAISSGQKESDHTRSISRFVTDKVSSYKRLRGGIFVIDALPKNPTGKVLKKSLKELNPRLPGPSSEGMVVAKL